MSVPFELRAGLPLQTPQSDGTPKRTLSSVETSPPNDGTPKRALPSTEFSPPKRLKTEPAIDQPLVDPTQPDFSRLTTPTAPMQNPQHHWDPSSWTTHDYMDLARECGMVSLRNFALRRGKPLAEVCEVFEAVVLMPLLAQSDPSPSAPSGTGPDRVCANRIHEAQIKELWRAQGRWLEQTAPKVRREAGEALLAQLERDGVIGPGYASRFRRARDGGAGGSGAGDGDGKETGSAKETPRGRKPVKTVAESTAAMKTAIADLDRSVKAVERKNKGTKKEDEAAPKGRKKPEKKGKEM